MQATAAGVLGARAGGSGDEAEEEGTEEIMGNDVDGF